MNEAELHEFSRGKSTIPSMLASWIFTHLSLGGGLDANAEQASASVVESPPKSAPLIHSTGGPGETLDRDRQTDRQADR